MPARKYPREVSLDELQPGDMLLKYDYHANIFYKWADSEHTWYWALEQSASSSLAVAIPACMTRS